VQIKSSNARAAVTYRNLFELFSKTHSAGITSVSAQSRDFGTFTSLAPFAWLRHTLLMHGAATIRFARVDFRNDDRVFGIKSEDRFSHSTSLARQARANRL
jgi:hypothetical protein